MLIIFYICFSFHSSSMDWDLVISIYYTKPYIHWTILYTQAPFPTFLFQLIGPMLNNKEESDLISPCFNFIHDSSHVKTILGEKMNFSPKSHYGKCFISWIWKLVCRNEGKIKKKNRTNKYLSPLDPNIHQIILGWKHHHIISSWYQSYNTGFETWRRLNNGLVSF